MYCRGGDVMNLDYIAGFFDGEGSVSIIHQRSPRKTNPEYRVHRLYANLTNTNCEVMVAVHEFLGFGYLKKKKMYSLNQNAKEIFIWESFGPVAARFLKLLENRLVVKKERAGVGIAFQTKLSEIGMIYSVDRTWTYDACDEMRRLNHVFGSAKVKTFCTFRNQVESLSLRRLSLEEVRRIKNSGLLVEDVVKKFGVSKNQASSILDGTRWSSVV